ncbi:MAG TPA: hypothetical protein VLH86_01650 [Patescibacteria group bacterium]|nr:hypothetical protein [Patescibacteria group bacterium]
MTVVTYGEFIDTPCPWVPDQPFWEQNAGAVQDVMALVAEDYPQAAATVDFDPTVLPPDEQRAALWKLLMGRQHGNQEQSDGKVDISAERAPAYLEALGRIAVGPYSVMEAVPVNPDVEYDQALMNGGTPLENILRLKEAFGIGRGGNNVREAVALTGQRMRGMWENIPGERSVEDLFETIGTALGIDMDALAARSPWIQAELTRNGEDWAAPFGTEYHIYRLVVEACMADYIDWDNYDETVHVQAPVGLNEEMQYLDGDKVVTVPPREDGAVTYELTDGRKCHVVNGAATARPNGAPRATSTSIAEEAMSYVAIPEDAALVAVSGAPHIRAAVDTAITYLDRAGGAIRRMDVAAGPWEPRITHLVACLGELMAGMKADYRLREVLRGGNPNKPELMSI